MLAEHAHLVDEGAELVELRLDYIRSALNLKRLIGDRPGPVVISCRRHEDGGLWRGNEEARQILLRSAIATNVEYVDIEEDVAASIPRFGKTKRIISYHNFRQTPDDIEAIHDRMMKHDADILKIVTTANQPSDNLRMLQLIRRTDIPTVAFCMGDIGTPSRILCGIFGAPFTYATFHHERTLVPGQLSFKEMVKTYRYCDLNEDTEVFAVIADPVEHSLSPMLHNRTFVQQGMNRVYLPFRVPAEDLEQFLKDCPEMGIKGLSVTIPHKEAILDYVSWQERAVSEIGAGNTILFDPEKGSVCYNTDYHAALASILAEYEREAEEAMLEGVQPKKEKDIEVLNEKTALILGAGGAAKAIAYALRHAGATVVITNRTEGRARELARALKCVSVNWTLRHEVKADLIVNCTPIGMHPNLNETPMEKRHLLRGTMVFDTVYNPEQTLLIKQAREQACRTITGIEMFVGQAAMQFNLFTGEQAPIDAMRETMRRSINPVRYDDD
jgi:3-dehydroquinate dehydratase/shikimate dehydrogenase